jgi:hypothetical protein
MESGGLAGREVPEPLKIGGKNSHYQEKIGKNICVKG